MSTIDLTQEYRITTIDNPFDPFEDFVNWYLHDVMLGYNTCEHVAKLTKNSDYFSDEEERININEAQEKIISTFSWRNYTRIYRNNKKPT